MPAEDPPEPRLWSDPPRAPGAPPAGPAEPPGPAMPRRLGAAGSRYPEESPAEMMADDEIAADRPGWRGYLPLGIGVAAGLVLLVALILVLHRGTPKQVAATSPAETETPEPNAAPSAAVAPPAAAPAPVASAPVAPAAPAPVAPAPVAPPVATAPPQPLTPPVPAKTAPNKPEAAVPANGPKHHRRTVAAAPWVVQAGAFQTEAHARRVADQLVHAGYRARVAPRPHGWFAIEVPGYKTKAEADAAAKQLVATSM